MTATISDEKYVSLTTFRADGTPRPVPVWIADLGDGTVGFTTEASSYKVKRINNNPEIRLQPCDSRGNVTDGSQPVAGSARIGSGGDFERVRQHIKSKYGVQVTLIIAFQKLAGLFGRGNQSDTAVIITLD